MLKNIKSSYIKQIILSYINKVTQLKLFKYNKGLQNIISVNLIDYIRLSERYIIYETKEKGKEYDSYFNILIYEGGFLNGKRNGIGKDYIKDYEGEYLNGKRNGNEKNI